MSVFRFRDLREDVGILVVEKVVQVYRWRIDLAEIQRRKREYVLRDFCLLSSIFRKPAQAELFSVIQVANDDQRISRVLKSIKRNPKLGFLVKELWVYCYVGGYDRNILYDLLDCCTTLTRIDAHGITTSFDVLARAKALKYLKLNDVSMDTTPNLPFKFKNLTSFSLTAPSRSDSSRIQILGRFPRVTNLSIYSSAEALKVEELYPQILALDIYPNEDTTLESFTSLQSITFCNSRPALISKLLSQVTTSLSTIRFGAFFYEFDEEKSYIPVSDEEQQLYDWKKLLSALDRAFESRLLNLLSEKRLEAIHGLKKGGQHLAEVNVEVVEESVLASWREGILGEEEVSDSEEEIAVNEEIIEVINYATVERIAVKEEIKVEISLENVSLARSNPKNSRERCRRAARPFFDLKIIEIWQHGKIMDPSFVKGRFYLRGKPNILETDLSEARKRVEKELIEETTKAEEEGKKGKKSKNPKYQSTWEVDSEEDGGRKVKGKKGRASIDR